MLIATDGEKIVGAIGADINGNFIGMTLKSYNAHTPCRRGKRGFPRLTGAVRPRAASSGAACAARRASRFRVLFVQLFERLKGMAAQNVLHLASIGRRRFFVDADAY